jgi:hypothetical protein
LGFTSFFAIRPGSFFKYFLIKKQTWEGFQQIQKKISPDYKVLVHKHFILADFQRQFLDKGYQKFGYFEH